MAPYPMGIVSFLFANTINRAPCFHCFIKILYLICYESISKMGRKVGKRKSSMEEIR